MTDQGNNGRLVAGAIQLSVQHGRGIGIVSGETARDGSGTVHVTLDPDAYAASFPGALSIRLPEEVARAVADAVATTCTRLDHLRALSRRSALAPSAFLKDQSTTLQIQQQRPASLRGVQLALLPEPLPGAVPELSIKGDEGRISYAAASTNMVRLVLTSVLAVRTRAGEGEPTARCYRMPDSRWLSEHADDPRDTDLEHLGFAFPSITYEVIASAFAVG